MVLPTLQFFRQSSRRFTTMLAAALAAQVLLSASCAADTANKAFPGQSPILTRAEPKSWKFTWLDEIPNGRRIDGYYFSAQPERADWIELFDHYGVSTVLNLRRESDDNGSFGDLDKRDQAYAVWQDLYGDDAFARDSQSSIPRQFRYYWKRSWIGNPSQKIDGFHDLAMMDFNPPGECRGKNDSEGRPTNCDHSRMLRIAKLLADTNVCPMSIHCHAGQGRTGSVMALLLYAFYGVDMNDAAKYALTHGGQNNGPDAGQRAYLRAFARDYPNTPGGALQQALGVDTLQAGCSQKD